MDELAPVVDGKTSGNGARRRRLEPRQALGPVHAIIEGDPLTDREIQNGLKLYFHAQHVAITLLMVARFSSLPENYSARDFRSFISKKTVMGALVALVLTYTIIFYSDTGTAFAVLAALQLGWPAIRPLLEKVFAFCQSWVNGGLNAVGIMQAAEESADYVMVHTNQVDPHRAALLTYKDQSKTAKLKRTLKEAAITAGVLAVTVPQACAVFVLEPTETFTTQLMTVLVGLPSGVFACADTFDWARDRSAVWNVILSQIEANLLILQNDLASDDSEPQNRGNRIIRELLEYLPELPKNATNKQIERAIGKTFNNGKGFDLIFKLLTMHGGRKPRENTTQNAAEYVIILRDPMSRNAVMLSKAVGAVGAVGSQGFTVASVQGMSSWFAIVPFFGLSAFTNLRLGWKGAKGVVEWAYDLFVRQQKGIETLGAWFSQRKTWAGWLIGNVGSLGVMGIGLGSITAAFSWGTNYLANENALLAFFNATGIPANSVVGTGLSWGGRISAITSSGLVNLKFYLLLFFLAKTALNLYWNGNDRTQRNTQFVEQAQLIAKRLREIPTENVNSMLAYLAVSNPDFCRIAIALCEQAGINVNTADLSGIMGRNAHFNRQPYGRNPNGVRFVWESAYRNFGNRGVNFWELPDISTLAPNLSPAAQEDALAQRGARLGHIQ